MLTAPLQGMTRGDRAIVAEVAAKAAALIRSHEELTLVAALKCAVAGWPLPSMLDDAQWFRYRLAKRACLNLISSWTLTAWDESHTRGEVLNLLANVASLARQDVSTSDGEDRS